MALKAVLSSVAAANAGAAALFGNGSDGDVAITGTVTLTRDMNYRNLTIIGSGSLVTRSFKVYINGVFDITSANAGAIKNNGSNGNAASGATGGAAIAVLNGTLPSAAYSLAVGGTGNTTTGTNPSVSGATNQVPFASVGPGGIGGAGGNGVSAAAAGLNGQFINTAAAIVLGANPNFLRWPEFTTSPSQIWGGLYGGPAGQGGGDAVFSGGGGGGAAAPGGYILISASRINRGSGTAAGAISVTGGVGGFGGNGGGGNTGGGGGGGGASGGSVLIIAGSILGSVVTNAINISGGAGGAGGNGFGTGLGGNGGRGGGAGSVVVTIVDTNTSTVTQTFAAGTVGGTTATTVGAAGGAGVTAMVNL